MRIFLPIFFIFCVVAGRAVAKPLDTIIASDADMIVSVRDITELRESWKEHPLVLDFGETSLSELFDEIFSQPDEDREAAGLGEILEEFGLTTDELLELFPEQVGLVIYDLSGMILQGEGRPDLAIIANFTGSAERMNELMRIQFERNAKAQKEANPAMEHEMIEEQFMGETLYFDEAFDGVETYVEDGYALVDGFFILASPEERLRSLVESIKEGAEQPISGSAAYLRVREESGPSDMMFYMNMESFLPPLLEALKKLAMEGGLAMFGVTGKSLETALALEGLQAFSLVGKIEEDFITSHSAIVYREKSGLLELLTYGEGALPAATYVPEGVLSSTVALFDLSEMFARVEALLGVASPSAPALLNIQIQQIKNQTGVDLRSSFLGNFGSEMVSFSVMPEAQSTVGGLIQEEQVYVFEIKNAAALSGAIEAIQDMIPGARAQIKTRDFEGETIHTITTPADPMMPDGPLNEISFVVTRSHLIFSVGPGGLIQGVITAMQSQDSGFWQSEEIEALVARVGKPGAVSHSYTDFGQVFKAVLQTISQATQMSGSGIMMDISKMPDLPWHMFTVTHEAGDGLFNHMILLRKEEL